MPQILESTPRIRPTPAPATNSIGAFLFDVDGVLADTARLHEAAWRRLAIREGLSLDTDTARSLRGLSRSDSLRRVLGQRRVTQHRFNELMEQKNCDYLRQVEQLTPTDVLPGSSELLEELPGFGIRVAAVSASCNARPVLDRLGLLDRFAAVVDGTDDVSTTGHRFLSASAVLRVEPSRCVVVEDSTTGAAAARQFGMKCLGLGDATALCMATMVFESLRGVDARSLLRWLTRTPH
ncbi:MAG: HAD-IA family hydrolase [Planctomycetota bacterium]